MHTNGRGYIQSTNLLIKNTYTLKPMEVTLGAIGFQYLVQGQFDKQSGGAWIERSISDSLFYLLNHSSS